jgi:hypothetical protein
MALEVPVPTQYFMLSSVKLAAGTGVPKLFIGVLPSSSLLEQAEKVNIMAIKPARSESLNSARGVPLIMVSPLKGVNVKAVKPVDLKSLRSVVVLLFIVVPHVEK